MRFLLHRTTRKALQKVKTATKAGGDTSSKAAGLVDAHQVRRDTPPVSQERHVQWGQQCSPTCGCVLRFQATVNSASQTYDEVGYAAKQVVTHPQGGGGATMLTARGRPMMKDCQCSSLHHLATEVTTNLQGKSVSSAKNMIEFHATRSSTAFRQTALDVQGLPSSDTGCFDVVEEALTAMVKGHMPPFRQAVSVSSSDTASVTSLKGRGHHHHHWRREEDEADNDLDFRKFWKDYEMQSLPGTMSTLAMLDMSMNLIATKDAKDETELSALPSLPQDWESYVDRLYEGDDDQVSA
jgi:hypothetical protein